MGSSSFSRRDYITVESPRDSWRNIAISLINSCAGQKTLDSGAIQRL